LKKGRYENKRTLKGAATFKKSICYFFVAAGFSLQNYSALRFTLR
jgi:hypothetical protein